MSVELRARPLVAGRFEPLIEIRASRMARVFWALDHDSGQHVGLKLPASADPHRAARIAEEGRILERLAHPAIVERVSHEHDPARDVHLATRWIEGETLVQRLERAPLTIAESVALAIGTASALAHAHDAGIVHCDVKPSNLILARGEPQNVVLIDFGIARQKSGRNMGVRTPFSGGTWAYMSPEQALGSELGPATDVFSLGCVLFECLSGVPAFPSERSAAVNAKLWKDSPRLDDHCSGVPQALTDLISKLLAKNPAARPANCTEVLRELCALGPQPDYVPMSFAHATGFASGIRRRASGLGPESSES